MRASRRPCLRFATAGPRLYASVGQSKERAMSDRQKHIDQLFTAELQFRFASAVRVATTMKLQPFDLPTEWTHGQHRVTYEEVALRQDQADFAARHLQRSATYLMAVAMKDAIRAVVRDPKNSTDLGVRSAYQIARLIRNAFAHAPFSPVWSIDPDCRNMIFSIPDIVTLDTANIHRTAFDWRQYGGPLAMFRLCRFVRIQILKDDVTSRKVVPIPKERYLQQGDMILRRVSEIPKDAVPVEIEELHDGRIPLGNGHFLGPPDKK